MFSRVVFASLFAVGMGMWSLAAAQTPSTQPAGAMPMGGMMKQCMQKMHATTQSIAQTNQTIEQAKQSNDPAKMRAALDEAQKELTGIQEHMAKCTGMMRHMMDMQNPDAGAMHHDMHGGMKGNMQPGMKMQDKDAGHEHAAAQAVDPVCGMKVDPAAAAKAEYDGKTYYFCSAADKAKFEADPGNYVKGK